MAALEKIAEINPRTSRALDDNATVSFVPMAAVNDGGGGYREETRSLSEVRNGYTSFQSGDVLLAKITPCMENGKVALLSELKHGIGFGSTEFHVLRAGPELDRRYLFHMVWNPRFRFLAEKRMTGSGGQRRVPTNFLREYEIPLPTLNDQARVAAILDKADAIRRKRRQALAEIDDLLRTTFFDMFGSMIEEAHVEPDTLLQHLVEPDRGVSYGVVQRGSNIADGVPIVRISNIIDNEFDGTEIVRTSSHIAEQYRRSIIRGGEILLSIRGTVGLVAIAPTSARGWNVSREVAVIPLRQGIHPEYVRMVMLTRRSQHFMAGEVKGVAQRGINLADVRKLPVPMPDGELLKRFLGFASAHSSLRLRAKAALALSDECFQSSAQRAFRGEL